MSKGRFNDHTGAMDDLRTGVADVGRSVSELREETQREMSGLREEMQRGISELRGEMSDLRGEMNRRFEALDQKVDRHFTWLVGIQVAVLVSVVGALVGSYYR